MTAEMTRAIGITEAPVLLTLAIGGQWVPVPRRSMARAARSAAVNDTRPSTFGRAPRFWVPVKRYRVALEEGAVRITSDGKTLHECATHAEAWAWLADLRKAVVA